ncbi:MAG: DUF6089 family protein [Cytophagales bacterium]|nr:DUF6089 family protein [Cytophagales bacterium]
MPSYLKILFSTLLICVYANLYAQRKSQAKDQGHHKATTSKSSTHSSSFDRKIHYPWSVFAGIGSCSYYGQLNSTKHTFKSLYYQLNIGLSYRFNQFLATQASIRYARIGSSDSQTGDVASGRIWRNLSFTTDIYEIAIYGMIDLFNFNWYRQADFYHAKGVYPYAIIGAGLLYFEPSAELDGKSYNLRSRITSREKEEGKFYSPISLFYDFGLGAKVKLMHFFTFGAEVTYTYTLTDYLDDLGYDMRYPLANKDPSFAGSIDGRLADRSAELLNENGQPIGRAEGNAKRTFTARRLSDGYFIFNLKVEYAFQSFSNFFNKRTTTHFQHGETPFHKRK